MKELNLNMQKPFLALSWEEQNDLLKTVREAINRGTTVVLGKTRCFLCGVPIEEEFYEARAGEEMDLNKKIGLVLNLCDDCTEAGAEVLHEKFPVVIKHDRGTE